MPEDFDRHACLCHDCLRLRNSVICPDKPERLMYPVVLDARLCQKCITEREMDFRLDRPLRPLNLRRSGATYITEGVLTPTVEMVASS